MWSARAVLFIVLSVAGGMLLVRGGDLGVATRAAADGPPVTFTCTWNAACPEITVVGDPNATLGGSPAPFRGYGDPSLERDPATGVIWLSYSWLDVLVSSPGPPPVVTFGVRTHLARSDDGGQTFTFVRAVNATQQITHPDTAAQGWTIHEVSTIAHVASGWESMWLTYFNPVGQLATNATDFYYSRSLAASPGQLGDSAQAWADGWATSPSFGVAHDLSQMPQLSDCAALTEPALFSYGGATYLATNCVVVVNGVRRPDLERLVLLREDPGGYTYLGVLLDYNDAIANGGEQLEQADLAVAQNGAILLIASPIQQAQPNNLGCRVFEVTDLATAQVRRDPSGNATVLASIAGDNDNAIGAGQCAYDAASSTGLVITMHTFNQSPFDITYTLRATGIHPQGLDADADGIADTADNCPAWPNAGQALPAWPIPTGDADCDGFPDSVAASGKAPEMIIGTDPAQHCAATSSANDEFGADAWPPDFNDDQKVGPLDVLKFSVPVYGSQAINGPPYSVRFAWDGNGAIGPTDVLKVIPFYGKSCA